MAPKGGTSGLQVSLHGGWYAVNGILIYEDTDHTNIFDLSGSNGNGGGRHYKFFVYFYNGDDPDPLLEYMKNNNIDPESEGYISGEPYYTYTQGDFDSPIEDYYIPGEPAINRNAVPLGEAWVPNNANNISDSGVHITSRDVIPSLEDVWGVTQGKQQLTVKALRFEIDQGDFKLYWRDMDLMGFSGQYNHLENGPLKKIEITGDNASLSGAYNYSQELVKPLKGENGAFVYVRSNRQTTNERNNFHENITADLLYFPISYDNSTADVLDRWWNNLAGKSEGYIGNDVFPYRPQLDTIYPVGFLRKIDDGSGLEEWVLHLSNGEVLQESTDFAMGRNNQYLSTLTSTTVGTSQEVDAENGEIDIDDVITNMNTIYSAGLDDAYDNFEPGTQKGAGRVIDADGGPVEIDFSEHSNYPYVQAAMYLDTRGGISPKFGVDMKGVGDAIRKRETRITRINQVLHGKWYDQTTKVQVDDSGNYLVLIPHQNSYTGQEYLNDNDHYPKDYITSYCRVEFNEGGSVSAENKIYEINNRVLSINGVSREYIVLRDLGNTAPSFSDFGLSSAGDSVDIDSTIYYAQKVGDTSVLDYLEVYKNLTAYQNVEFKEDLDVAGDVKAENSLEVDTIQALFSTPIDVQDNTGAEHQGEMQGKAFWGDNTVHAMGRFDASSGSTNGDSMTILDSINVDDVIYEQDGFYTVVLDDQINMDKAIVQATIDAGGSDTYMIQTTTRNGDDKEFFVSTYTIDNNGNVVKSRDSDDHINFTVHIQDS